MPGRSTKESHQYICDPTDAHVGHEDYTVSPGSAFLRYTVEAKDAVNLAARVFTRKNDGSYRKDSLDSLQHITAAFLPSIMGHFDTFQRYLFAGMFDSSSYLDGFVVDKFFSYLAKHTTISIDLVRLAVHRGIGAESIGLVLADSLIGWHTPHKVNEYFNAFGLKRQLWSTLDCSRLAVLWQLGHAIVHTGGTLTPPGAQKHDSLKPFGNRKTVFENQFVMDISRRLHPMIKRATEGIGVTYQSRLLDTTPRDVIDKLGAFFSVESSMHAWFDGDESA